MKTGYRQLLLTTAVLAFACTATAQETTPPAEEESSFLLGTVTVTATRREENMQTVPVSVTAVTEAQIEALGLKDVSDLERLTPNLAIKAVSGKPNDPIIVVRGMLNRSSDATLDTAVGVYSDEVFLGRGYSVLGQFLDIDRVEVLRGPQGTLFGRNTIGGAIQVVTKKPVIGGDSDAYVSAGTGNFNLIDLKAAGTLPLGDKAAIRLAGNYLKHDGFTTSYLVDDTVPGYYVDGVSPMEAIDTNDKDNYALRASFAVEPTPSSRLDLSAYKSKSKTNGVLTVGIQGDLGGGDGTGPFAATPYGGRAIGQANSQVRQNDFWSGVTDVRPSSESDVEIYTGKFQYDFANNMTLKAILSNAQASQVAANNADGIVAGMGTPLIYENSSYPNSDVEQSTAELQLAGSSDRIDWIAGLYYFTEEAHDRNWFIGNGVIGPSTLVDVVAENTSQSIYGSATFRATDRFSVRAGGRYTEDEKGYTGRTTDSLGACIYGAISPCLFTPDPAESQKFTWDISGDYSLTDNIFAYAKVATGYRTGGISLNANSADTALPFREDEVISYEAGIKADIGNTARINLTAFYVDYSDIQQNFLSGDAERVGCIPVGSAPIVQTLLTCNAGDATSQGFEIEGSWQLTSNLGLRFGGGYTDFAYDDPSTIQVFLPEWNYSLTGVYDIEVAGRPLQAMLSYQSSADFYSNGAYAVRDQSRFDGYSLLDARLSYEWNENLELAVWGRNLANEEYFETGTYAANPVFVQHYGNPGAPRTYGATMTYRF